MNLARTLDVVIIPAASFLMGSDQGQENEQPVHRVWLDNFGIGRYPVTNQDYAIYLEQTGSAAPPFWFDSMFSAPAQSVVGVTWEEAVAFCLWLSERSGRQFHLPTEAEWEYAARGG
ncbi:MAG: formylglycine-generating enzyme family protein, partial [Candidatus Binatia bacterium]